MAPKSVSPTKNSRPPLRRVAYERFREHLLYGSLSPGQLTSQKKLCKLLDVPMGAMREALKRLEMEGLILLLAQRGIQIREINLSLINESFEFRLLLESAAVRRFVEDGCTNLLIDVAIEVREIFEMSQTVQTKQKFLDRALEVDNLLHNTIISTFDNSVITDTYRMLTDKVRLIRMNSRYDVSGVTSAMGEHIAIIEAIEKSDADAAVKAVENHIQTSWHRSLGIRRKPSA